MKWTFPLDMKLVGKTTNSMSFQKINIKKEVEIPVGKKHVGACGDTGSGKAESPRKVVEIVNKFLKEREFIL